MDRPTLLWNARVIDGDGVRDRMAIRLQGRLIDTIERIHRGEIVVDCQSDNDLAMLAEPPALGLPAGSAQQMNKRVVG